MRLISQMRTQYIQVIESKKNWESYTDLFYFHILCSRSAVLLSNITALVTFFSTLVFPVSSAVGPRLSVNFAGFISQQTVNCTSDPVPSSL